MTTTPAPPRRARARRGEGERLREEILDAAGRLLLDTGSVDAVSIRAVADAAGVTPPSIYLHFPDKDALMAAVCAVRFGEFDAYVDSAGAASDDPVESLLLRGRAYVRFGVENPEHYRILFMSRSDYGLDTPGHEAAAAAFEHLVGAVTACIDSGAFAPRDPTLVSIQLWVTLHGLTSLLISKQGFPWPPLDELVETILRAQITGLAAG